MQARLKSIIKNYSFLKWASVGIATSVIDVFSFVVTYKITESVILANTLAVFTAQSFNYLSHYLWSFKSESSHFKSLTKYVLVTFIWWFFGIVMISIFIKAGIPVTISKILPIMIMTPFNFFLLKYFVYREN